MEEDGRHRQGADTRRSARGGPAPGGAFAPGCSPGPRQPRVLDGYTHALHQEDPGPDEPSPVLARLAGRRPRGGGRPRRDRPLARRAGERRLLRGRRRVHLPRRLPLLLRLPRRAGPLARRHPRDARGAARRRARLRAHQPLGGAGPPLRRDRGPGARSSAPPSPRSSATCRGRCGSWRARCSAAACRTS